ncbi:MAG: hypothetical protein RL172_1970 [Bacteroidota bacterium]|jgi:UPF0755 protein
MFAPKKTTRLILLLLLIAAGYLAYVLLGSNTRFTDTKKAVYIPTGSNLPAVVDLLTQNNIISNPGIFKMMAKITGYNNKVKPGKYVFENGSSLTTIFRTLQSGRQTAVNLVITKLRTNDDLALKIASNFECDTAEVLSFFNNNDSLKRYGLDTNTAMTMIVPNTYAILWTTPLPKIIRRLQEEQQKFWTPQREQKAAALHLSYQQVYTLASIVEEETNIPADKGKIASVYINRMAIGMPLGADPTIKFALKNFSLKRIYQKHLGVASPYNTYLNRGLPPGPICTPSVKTIDAVLDAPTTNYLYFVAKPNLDGYSNFAATYTEHLKYARAYQQALDTLMAKKAEGRE